MKMYDYLKFVYKTQDQENVYKTTHIALKFFLNKVSTNLSLCNQNLKVHRVSHCQTLAYVTSRDARNRLIWQFTR